MKKVFVVLLIIVGLFISSSQTYEQQSLIPSLGEWLPTKPFEEALTKVEIPYWGYTISVEERGYYAFIEFLVRKSAHFFIFGFLAIAIYTALPRSGVRTLFALLITLLAACADEYHQSLTGGRTASLHDVFLDMSGAVSCLIVWQILLVLFGRRKKPLQSRSRV